MAVTPAQIAGQVHEPTELVNEERIRLPPSSRIDSFCLINGAGGVIIGSESCIHAQSSVIGSGGLRMGDRAVICYGVRIITSTADLRYPASSVVPAAERGSISEVIELGDESFIGSNAVLMPGVRVGEAGVVAAGAYCDEDVPAGHIYLPDGSLTERPGDWPRGDA